MIIRYISAGAIAPAFPVVQLFVALARTGMTSKLKQGNMPGRSNMLSPEFAFVSCLGRRFSYFAIRLDVNIYPWKREQ
jgi:hypothetical protein